jgi:hypothetical protein
MRNHKVFTLWLLMIRERVKEEKVPRISRKMTIRIFVSSAIKGGI